MLSLRLSKPFVALATGMLAVGLLSACPPPPPPPEDAGEPPNDAGPGQVGTPCFSDAPDAGIDRECDLGLECGELLSADGGVFGCTTPGVADAPCFFNSFNALPEPPDDGCVEGLSCSSEGACILNGSLNAPCSSPSECTTSNCGTLPDGSGTVCVVNECFGGCDNLNVCRSDGQCGLTCVAPPANNETCFQAGTGPCFPLNIPCASGLECFRGDAATQLSCGVPGGEGSGCNPDSLQDGCRTGFHCDNAVRSCKENQ